MSCCAARRELHDEPTFVSVGALPWITGTLTRSSSASTVSLEVSVLLRETNKLRGNAVVHSVSEQAAADAEDLSGCAGAAPGAAPPFPDMLLHCACRSGLPSHSHWRAGNSQGE